MKNMIHNMKKMGLDVSVKRNQLDDGTLSNFWIFGSMKYNASMMDAGETADMLLSYCTMDGFDLHAEIRKNPLETVIKIQAFPNRNIEMDPEYDYDVVPCYKPCSYPTK